VGIEIGEMVMILSRLFFGAIAAFLAIVLWSQTRDSAWVFIVMGVIVQYGEIMYNTLQIFGIINWEGYLKYDIPLIPLALANFPTIFFTTGFVIMILRSRVRYNIYASKLKREEKSKEDKN